MRLKLISSTLALAALLSGCVSTNSANTAEIKTQIAVEHIRLGNVDMAKNALDEAIQRNPNNAQTLMMMGVTHQLVGTSESLTSAEQYFTKAIELEPRNAQIRNNYGQYLFVVERYEDAIKEFNVASNTIGYSGRDVALNNLGQSYLRLNQISDAKNFFLRALQLNPKYPEALLGLAEIHYLLADSDEAADVFQDYIDLVGHARLDAKALWLAIRIDRMNNNAISMREHVEELYFKFPKSEEYKKYSKQRSSPDIWR